MIFAAIELVWKVIWSIEKYLTLTDIYKLASGSTGHWDAICNCVVWAISTSGKGFGRNNFIEIIICESNNGLWWRCPLGVALLDQRRNNLVLVQGIASVFQTLRQFSTYAIINFEIILNIIGFNPLCINLGPRFLVLKSSPCFQNQTLSFLVTKNWMIFSSTIKQVY